MNYCVSILSLAIFICSPFVRLSGQTKEKKFFQDFKTEIKLPPEAGKNVIKLSSESQSVTAVTSNGIFRFRNGSWSGQSNGSDWQTATVDKQGKIWLAAFNFIQKENSVEKLLLPESSKTDTILCLFWEDDKTLHVGTTGGLLTWNSSWNIQPEIKVRVNSVVTDVQKNLWVATIDGLWQRSGEKWINLDETLMASGNTRTYFSLKTQNDGKDVLFSSPWSVGFIAGDGNHWAVRGADGLPYGPVKVIRVAENGLWFGTDKGAIRKDSGWHYFNDRRWLPDNKVNDILPINAKTVWIATPAGISQIQQVEITLEQKAAVFEKRIRERHIRHGLVSSSKFSKQGDVTTNYIENSNNDGLWTSIYLVAECFRYAVTHEPEARENAEMAFEAMERLETVTGIPGFPARSIALPDEKVGKGEWHLSSDKKWKWLGDTSSDEIVGHFFAYPIFYDLVANDKMKKRVEVLVSRILNYVINNDFQLIDADKMPTRWGVWNPDSLNNSPNWSYETGTNSLQILSFLNAGFYMTQNKKFSDTSNLLTLKYGYGQNIVELKKYGPFDVSFVDNQLSFLPYYVLGKYSSNNELKPYFEKSISRTWNVVKNDKIAMWNIITSAILGKDCGLKDALDELQSIPMEMIYWKIDNSHRWDLQHDFMVDRMGNEQAVKPIPASERGITKWNLNPYQLVSKGDGMGENDGAYFLLAYWMGRYYKFWD